jgi:hypothetical protein
VRAVRPYRVTCPLPIALDAIILNLSPTVTRISYAEATRIFSFGQLEPSRPERVSLKRRPSAITLDDWNHKEASAELERFSLGCMAPVHAKRQPAKENSRLIPSICSGTALGVACASQCRKIHTLMESNGNRCVVTIYSVGRPICMALTSGATPRNYHK